MPYIFLVSANFVFAHHYLLEFFLFFNQLNDFSGIFVRPGHLFEDEACSFTSGLDMNSTKIKQRWDYALEFRGYILDTMKFLLGNRSVEQALLFDIDYSVVGNDPHIQVVVNEGVKSKQPDIQIINTGKEQNYRINVLVEKYRD